jgi:molybdenum cofactor cytidylyltransferase
MLDRSTPVSAIVLAAGASRRMGRQKLLLPIGGRPLLARVVDAVVASRVGETIVVVGWESEDLAAILSGKPVRIVPNPDWAEGQSHSLRVGLAAVTRDAGAALFCAADQPWLTTDLINTIIDRWRATGASIVVPTIGSRRGGPVLFSREWFPELAALRGDSGGRQVLAGHRGDVEVVPVGDPRLLQDIDTEEDYLRALTESGIEVIAP